MAAPVSPCDSCGSPIPDSDLETGAAIILLSKRYCSACKSEAMQSVSLDDLGPKAAPARAAAPPPPPKKPAPAAKAPSPKPAPPPPKAAPPAPPKPAVEANRPERKAPPARRPSTSAPAASRKPLLIGGVAVAVIAIVGAVLLLRGHPGPSDHGQPPTKGGATGPVTTSPEDREAQARDAFAKVLDLSNRTGVSWDLVLAAADKARPACRGTACEKKLEEIRTRAVQEKEAEEASREITPLLDELKGAVATDPEFKRYPELQTKFQIALETASKAGSIKRDEIRALQRDYNGRYEKLAEPHYTEINEAAIQLADERRFDDAIRKINTFPQHLRHSGAWMNLEKLKKDIERRKQK